VSAEGGAQRVGNNLQRGRKATAGNVPEGLDVHCGRGVGRSVVLVGNCVQRRKRLYLERCLRRLRRLCRNAELCAGSAWRRQRSGEQH
jgi:hypothetical protein